VAPRDPAWDAFVTELRQYMSARGMSASMLAVKLGVDEEMVRNWRKGRTHPQLSQLPLIAAALGMTGDTSARGLGNPLHLLRQMGLLPHEPDDQELFDAAYRLQKLELKLAEAMDRAGSYGRREGAGGVVRAAVASGSWAVAVWPAIEGTSECPLHVADRLDIRRTDGRATSSDEVWRDPGLKAALRAAYAVPATRSPRWSSDETVSHWAISYIGSPRGAVVSSPHPGITSVACVALTVDSWINDIASLLAVCIGYGLTTTRDLAMEAYGLHSGATLPEHRRAAHSALLQRPPETRVWSHHAPLGIPVMDPLLPPFGRWRDDVLYVWMRESDEVLQQWLERPQSPGTLNDLVADRDHVDALVAALNSPQIVSVEVERRDSATDRWQQVLEAVSTILTTVVDRGLLSPKMDDVHEMMLREDPDVAVPLFAWLAADGCAAFA